MIYEVIRWIQGHDRQDWSPSALTHLVLIWQFNCLTPLRRVSVTHDIAGIPQKKTEVEAGASGSHGRLKKKQIIAAKVSGVISALGDTSGLS